MKKLLQNKKRIVAIILALFCGLETAWAYDFSAVCSSGQTLYYTITNSSQHFVKIVYPGSSNSNPWGNVPKPQNNLVLPNTVLLDNTTYYVKAVDNYAFYGCTGLTNVTVGDGITSLGDYSFYGCTNISGLTIGEGITSVGDYSFWNCPSLATVHFNAVNCGDMYTYGSSSPYYFSVFNSGTTQNGPSPITTLTIGSGVNRIPNYAFRNSPSLNQTLSIPGYVTYIGKEAFLNCSALHGTLTIPNSVTSIGADAFNGCSGFTGTLTLSNQLGSIGAGAFCGCSGINGHVVIPNSVGTLGDYSFYGCTNITELTIGEGVTSVGDYSFWNCPSLATVHFNAVNCGDMYTYGSSSPYYFSVFNSGTTQNGPSSITTLTIGSGVNRIPNYAFRNSPSILGVSFPQVLTTIGTGAFYDCINLGSLTLLSTTPPSVGNNAFYNVALTIPVFVPCNLSGTYNAANGWNQFSNIIELCSNQIVAVAFPPNGGTVIGSGTYAPGQICFLTALPNSGYSFVHWTKNGTVVSTNTTYSFTVTESGSYVAI
ncbi:MAG: leucine-rich repeat protein, partial [Bacteroidales bacterium]|nr:leucine-rich repeat protein [Bacteroidales bacterium]